MRRNDLRAGYENEDLKIDAGRGNVLLHCRSSASIFGWCGPRCWDAAGKLNDPDKQNDPAWWLKYGDDRMYVGGRSAESRADELAKDNQADQCNNRAGAECATLQAYTCTPAAQCCDDLLKYNRLTWLDFTPKPTEKYPLDCITTLVNSCR